MSNDPEPARASVWRALRAAINLALNASTPTLVALALTMTAGALSPMLLAWLIRAAVDLLTTDAGRRSLIPVAMALIGASLLSALGPAWVRFLQAELERSVERMTRTQLYGAVSRIPYLDRLEAPEFRDRMRMADHASRGAPAQVAGSALGIVTGAIGVLGLVSVVWTTSPTAAGLLLAGAIPAGVAEHRLNHARATMIRGITEHERRQIFYSDLIQSLDSAKELRLFGTGNLFHARMQHELTEIHQQQRAVDRTQLRTQLALGLCGAALAGAAGVAALATHSQDNTTAGGVAAVFLSILAIQGLLTGTIASISSLQLAILLFTEYHTLLETLDHDPPQVTSPNQNHHPMESGLVLEDVWFRYQADSPWVLQGVSMRIAPTEIVALVGSNGAGKSTLIKLIARLYQPTRGMIRLDGVDIASIDLEDYRRQVSGVFQDFMTYELTLAENIGLGNADGALELAIDHNRLSAAATQAGLDECIASLPRGPQTLLSRIFTDDEQRQGSLLSGGQWQRVALARAAYRGPRKVLIYDEPSSGLDADAEKELVAAMTEHAEASAQLIISHRLGITRYADRIVVLEHGQVTGDAGHEELLGTHTLYSRMFLQQAAGYTTGQHHR